MTSGFPFAHAEFPCYELNDALQVVGANEAAEALPGLLPRFDRLLDESETVRLHRGLPVQLPWNRVPGMVCTLNLLPLETGFAALLQPMEERPDGYSRALEKMLGRRAYVNQLAKDYKADGIIYEQVKFCDPWAYERMVGTQVLRDEYGYPVLSVDRPYAVGSSGQLRTRVQAFVESMEIKKIQGGAVHG